MRISLLKRMRQPTDKNKQNGRAAQKKKTGDLEPFVLGDKKQMPEISGERPFRFGHDFVAVKTTGS